MTAILYAARGGFGTTSDLYTLDPATGAETSVGPIGFGVTGLAFDPTDGTLYGSTNNNSASNPKSLITIDPVTGAGTLVGAFGGGAGVAVPDLAFDSTGQLWGWRQASNKLTAINKATAGLTDLGASGLSTFGGGTSFDSGDVCYTFQNGSLGNYYTVNTVTGATTLAGTLVPGAGITSGAVNAAAFDGVDLLWAIVKAFKLVTINVATGDETLIGDMAGDETWDALAWSLSAAPTPTYPVRIGVAFDDPTLEETPVWTYLTDSENLVAGYSVDRGRQYEFDKTDTGTATVTINDVDGILDPTNVAGPYYGLIEPLLQIQVELYNPVTATYSSRFRGFIEDYNYAIDPSQVVTRLTIECVDLFEILTAIEMQPGEFGDTPPTESAGQVFFDNASAHDRITQALGNAGIPTGFYVVFTLNVDMLESVYSPSENVLQVIQDAADAEFPTVSNVYVDRLGRLAVHGRLAKFDPVTVAAGAAPGAWEFTYWKAGDGDAVAASISDTAQIRTLSFNRGLSKVFNSCLCTPNGIADSAVAGQLSKDTTSIGQYGIRSWSAENLLIDTGTTTSNTGLVETHQFAIFIKERYKTPRNRVTELTFRSMAPDDPRAAANWALLVGADISDLIDLTETSPGGGGFTAVTWFIEGIHEEVQPLNGQYADVTLSLDLSPGDIFIGHGSGTGYTLDG